MAEDLVLGVDFDLSQVEKSINKMQSQFNSAAKEMEKLPKVIADLDARIEEINQKEKDGVKLTQQEKQLRDSLVNQSSTYAARLQEVTDRAAQLGAELENARMDPAGFAQANGLIDRTADSAGQAADETKRLDNNARKASSGFKETSSSASLLVKGITSATSGLSNFTNRIAGLAKRVFVFSVITRALRKIREVMSKAISSNERLSSTLSRAKGNISVAFQPIIQRAVPYLETLCSWLERATQFLAIFIHRLTEADMKTSIQNAKKLHDTVNDDGKSTQYDKQIKAIDKQIKAYQKQIKALQANEKALKKQYEAEKKVLDKQKSALKEQIDGIEDYISALRKQEKAAQQAVDAQRDAISQQIKLLQSQKKARQAELDDQRKATNTQIDAINKEIKALQKQKRAREKELRQDDKSLAGFDTMQILSGSEDEDPEIQAIDAQIEALEEKREALQEIADAIPTDSDDPFIQQIEAQIEALQAQKEAIEDVDYSPMIEQQEAAKESIQEQIELLDKRAEKLQEEYELKLEVQEEAIDKIQDQIDKLNDEKDKLSELKDASKETADSFNESLSEMLDPSKMDDAIKKVEDFVSRWGWLIDILLAIIGLIGYITGSPALLLGAIAAAIAVIKVQWEILKGKMPIVFNEIAFSIKNIRKMVVGYLDMFERRVSKWPSGLGGIFQFIIGLVKSVVSIIFGIFETLFYLLSCDFEKAGKSALTMLINLANGLISAIEGLLKVILGLIVLSLRPITELIRKIGEIAGWEGWDPNPAALTEWSFPRIPALARGAVIPGGKPWIAMLGDQPAGQTNVEAPLDTIKQALAEALAERGGEDITIHVSFDGTTGQLVRLLEPQFETERKRRSAFA